MVRGCFRDILPFVYGPFCKTKIDGIIKETCLLFPEQDESPKTNLRMFKLDNKLMSKKKTFVMGITMAHNVASSGN